MKLFRFIVFLPAFIALCIVLIQSFSPEKLPINNSYSFKEVYLWNSETESFYLADLSIKNGLIDKISPRKSKTKKLNQYILPGFINSHVHLVNTSGCEAGYDFSISTFTDNLQVLMSQGFTTVADMAGWPDFILNMKTWMIEEDFQSPQIFMAGPVITTEDGYPHYWLPSMSEVIGAVDFLDEQSAEELYKKLNKFHVDYIKIGLQEMTFGGKELPLIEEEKLKALIQIAHQQNKKVMVHALTRYGYELGLKLNVDAFIHGPLEVLPDDLIDQIIEQDISIIPTIWVWKSTWHIPENDPRYYLGLSEPISGNMYEHYREYIEDYKNSRNSLPEYVLHENNLGKSEMKIYHDNLITNLKKMKKRGVKFAFGTDAPFCFNTIGSSKMELQELKGLGFSNHDLLEMMTIESAKLLGKEKSQGMIKEKYKANLNIYRQNPLKNLDILLKPNQILVGGQISNPDQDLTFIQEVKVAWVFVKSFFHSITN